jgi:hypothetical protein
MNQARNTRGRPPARSGGASPAAQVVLVIIMLVVGFLILRSFGDDDGSAETPDTDDTTGVTDDTSDGGDTTTTPATTLAPLSAAKVVVANGAGVGGLAGKTTEYLTAQGIATATATDANTRYTTSAVYYQPGLESQAQQIATILGIAAVQPFPTQLPLADPAAIADANVLVLLGQDFATSPIATGTASTTATGTTAPPTSV